MDILSRVRDLLNGRKSYKRKSSLSEEYEFDGNKKFRMSEQNGDYELEPHIVNSGIHFDSAASVRNISRRSEPFIKNCSKSSFLTSRPYDQTNEQNDNCPNYINNGRDTQWSEFKQPMPPPLTNGSKRVPALISATKNTFDRTMFQRSFNQPQQTITPHYNRFGESSELVNFKSVPDLYPITTNRSNANASYSSGGLANGHDHPLFASTKFNSQLHQRSVFGGLSSSSLLGSSNPIFNNSVNSRTSSSMSLKDNSVYLGSDHANPPRNLSRSRYQDMLKLVPGYNFLRKSKKNAVNDTSVQGIIDISEDDAAGNNTASSSSTTPNIERVNSLKTRLETKEVFNENWEQRVNEKYSAKSLERRDSLRQIEEENVECERKTRDTEDRLKESFNKITISSYVYEEEEEEEPPNDYPNIEIDKQKRIMQWIGGRDVGTVLISKFNLSVTRHDIQTLQWNPLTWLNDEVINFYMELLAERSRSNDKLPKVHGMNTFFLKRLQETGYSGVRRWTRKVDIFAHDIIPVPVHKGIHWCMAIIHLKNKTIKYYDSMGAPNNPVLSALAEYLKSESLDKKKTEFDMAGWKLENVRNIPQQENGSDCGVFSCMYAEFVTRNRPIVFTQQHMQYFRMKMVYEICTGQMLN